MVEESGIQDPYIKLISKEIRHKFKTLHNAKRNPEISGFFKRIRKDSLEELTRKECKILSSIINS